MAVPATKAMEFYGQVVAILDDPSRYVSPFELHRYYADAKSLMDAATAHEIALMWSIVGRVERRRGDLEASLHAFKNAALASRSDPHSLINLATAYGKLRRVAEAWEHLERASALADTSEARRMVMLNRIAAYVDVDHLDLASREFDELIAMTEDADPRWNYHLARTASSIGRHWDCVEFSARFVCTVQGKERGENPALDVIDAAPREIFERLAIDGLIRRSLEIVRAEENADDAEVPPERVLSPDGWLKLEALLGA